MPTLRNILKKSFLLRTFYPFYVKTKSKLHYFYLKHFSHTITEDELISQFSSIGILPKDKIMIHSSMTKIGLLENGAQTVVEALKRYITPNGLIVMPSFPHRNMYEYLEKYEIFDVEKTPSKNGAISEYLRKSEGVYRSLHPTHPLVAWGKNAKELMSEHENHTRPFEEGTPFKKLLDLDIKILLIGVNLEHVTMIRVIEDCCNEYPVNPYMKDKIYTVKIKDCNENLIDVQTVCHDPVFFSKERFNMAIYPHLKKYTTFAKLGNADTWLFSSQKMFETQIECMKKGVHGMHKKLSNKV